MRYILQHQGFGTSPEQLRQAIGEDPLLTFLEQMSDQIIVVDGGDEHLKDFTKQHLGWVCHPVRQMEVPDATVRPQRGPRRHDE